MSRLEFLRSPRRVPGLLLLSAVFDSWAFEEARRQADLKALGSCRRPPGGAWVSSWTSSITGGTMGRRQAESSPRPRSRGPDDRPLKSTPACATIPA